MTRRMRALDPFPPVFKRLSSLVFVLAFLLALSSRVTHAQESVEGFEEGLVLYTTHCIACHTIGDGERVSSDLIGITKRRDREWLIGYIGNAPEYILNDPLGQELFYQYENMPMPKIDITREEIETILGYVDAAGDAREARIEFEALPGFLSHVPVTPEFIYPKDRRGVSTAGLVASAVVLLMGAALWKLGLPKGGQVFLVCALAGLYWAGGGRAHHVLLGNGNHQGYAPEQPIAYSHALHSGELQITCLYCHSGAAKGPVAGVPAVSTCMNCHAVVRKLSTETTNSTQIAALVAAWDSLKSNSPESIEWVRVHKLADFVKFDHQMHVNNNIQCQECHGAVETMDRIRQVSALNMGWCIQCHARDADSAPAHWKKAGATLDCAACHH